MKKSLLVFSLLTLASAFSAYSEIVQLTVQSDSIWVNREFGPFANGSQCEVIISYDTDTPDSDPDPGLGLYESAVTSLLFVLDDGTYLGKADSADIRVFNPGPMWDENMSISNLKGIEFPSVEGADLSSLSIWMELTFTNPVEVFNPDALPVNLDPDDFQKTLEMEIFGRYGEGYDQFFVGVISSFETEVIPTAKEVVLDIDPSSEGNFVPIHSNGLLKVAVYSDEDTDISDIEPTSVSLGKASIASKGKSGKLHYRVKDLNKDGKSDFEFSVNISDLELEYAENDLEFAATTAEEEELVGTSTVSGY